MNKKKIKLSEILPVIEETLSSGATVEIPITGTSMLPLLVAGRDTVVLKKADGQLKKYDIAFYRRDDGSFVLHRVIKAQNGSYVICGDNQWVKEYGIEDRHIIGVVSQINRGSEKISVDNVKYRLYCRFWTTLLPVRKYIIKLKGKLKK